MMLAPPRAMQLETAATIPWRSAQEISNRAIGTGAGSWSLAAGALVPAAVAVIAAGSQHRSDLALERRDVLGQDVAREGGLARGDRMKHVVMLVHAGEQVRQPIEHEMPDPKREGEGAAERLLPVGSAR